MFATLPWFSWLRLGVALILFVGPGYGLLSFYPDHKRFDRTQIAALGFVLAISLWAIILAWLDLARVALTPAMVGIILASGWAIGLVRSRPWHSLSRPFAYRTFDVSRILLWAVLTTIAVVAVWSLRNVIVGPGSDSYHHTLITQLIIERGALPHDYQPYAPLVTFTYHYGFHAFAAAVAMLTDLDPVVVTPVLAQLLTAAAALSVAFFTEAATGSRPAAAVSAIIAGFICVFPAYLINWGRYTQLTGMVLLPVFLGLVWQWARGEWSLPAIVPLGVLAAGIALTHYRVSLMAVSGVIVLVGVGELTRRSTWAIRQTLLLMAVKRLTLVGAVGVALVMPWFWHLFGSRSFGYPIVISDVGPTFFSLEGRFGPSVINYPTNWVLLGLVLTAILLGLIWRDRLVIGLTLWAAIMLVLSTPYFAGTFMDTVSVVISLYIPAAVAIGWMVVRVIEWFGQRGSALRRLAWAALVGLAVWGAVPLTSIVEPPAAYVWADDVPAMTWIRENTPSSARFMVNTYNWDFSPDFIIGIDAGYWLPLLAGRATVTSPMIYSIERASTPDFLADLVAVHRLDGHFASPQALATLRNQGVTHIYIGSRGGPIVVDELQKSSAFELIYHNGTVYVFRLVETT